MVGQGRARQGNQIMVSFIFQWSIEETCAESTQFKKKIRAAVQHSERKKKCSEHQSKKSIELGLFEWCRGQRKVSQGLDVVATQKRTSSAIEPGEFLLRAAALSSSLEGSLPSLAQTPLSPRRGGKGL